MKSISATQAKHNFSAVIDQAASEAVAIERHGKIVAVIAPPAQLANAQAERQLARAQQRQVEADRLIRHQGIAIRLLKDSNLAKRQVKAAKAVVDRWEREHLCSQHFISRWRALLSLPVPDLAERMCGDPEGWGNALRQNSPWTVAADE